MIFSRGDRFPISEQNGKSSSQLFEESFEGNKYSRDLPELRKYGTSQLVTKKISPYLMGNNLHNNQIKAKKKIIPYHSETTPGPGEYHHTLSLIKPTFNKVNQLHNHHNKNHPGSKFSDLTDTRKEYKVIPSS